MVHNRDRKRDSEYTRNTSRLKMQMNLRHDSVTSPTADMNRIYRFTIVSHRLASTHGSLSIGGKQVETIERARDGTACAYSAYHSTKGISASARGHREELPIAMRVFGSGYLTTCLQIKYYRQDDQSHCEWGARLHCIELDCSSVEGRLVTVDRETYRKLGIES
ncbi:hypothetical protein K0M31_019987 [Melipona bicolor]|uniref:CB1 cannabinoid receptor-interacting protein 1 n=1 Tax=Melipona bicolor TaxID=60889 RepID=A0AA40KQI1_9HYME|nr:hypothetical protein K0M31_019987 [Melipona bicolor]